MLSLLLTLLIYIVILALLYWIVTALISLLASPPMNLSPATVGVILLIVKIIFAIILIMIIVGIFFEGTVPVHKWNWT